MLPVFACYLNLQLRADTQFTCLFCHHDKSVTVRMDRKEGLAELFCKVCDQRYQSKVNRACAVLPAIILC